MTTTTDKLSCEDLDDSYDDARAEAEFAGLPEHLETMSPMDFEIEIDESDDDNEGHITGEVLTLFFSYDFTNPPKVTGIDAYDGRSSRSYTTEEVSAYVAKDEAREPGWLTEKMVDTAESKLADMGDAQVERDLDRNT